MALRLLPISLLTVLAFHFMLQEWKFDENSTSNIDMGYMDKKIDVLIEDLRLQNVKMQHTLNRNTIFNRNRGAAFRKEYTLSCLQKAENQLSNPKTINVYKAYRIVEVLKKQVGISLKYSDKQFLNLIEKPEGCLYFSKQKKLFLKFLKYEIGLIRKKVLYQLLAQVPIPFKQNETPYFTNTKPRFFTIEGP